MLAIIRNTHKELKILNTHKIKLIITINCSNYINAKINLITIS